VTRHIFALVLTRFSGSDFCRTLIAYIMTSYVREIVCTHSRNIEVMCKPSKMVIKMWEVCLLGQKMEEWTNLTVSYIMYRSMT
jgi:hypothetical protein